ncbi:MAG TPA: hybrid sensor histidine kinase/response regulator, partial [Chthoniobacteraceae bacterium]
MHSAPPFSAALAERNQRVLIVDDNTSIHEDIRKILGAPAKEDANLDLEAAALFDLQPETQTGVDFQIDSAFQGHEGLKMVQTALDEGRPYALAFIDVRMPPGWDGIETIGHIWRAYPELQVVICTAYSDYSWEEMIRHVGRTDSL